MGQTRSRVPGSPRTWDVFTTLDGFGSYNAHGDWGGYWGKQGPEFLDRRAAQYGEELRLVLGANTFRMFQRFLGTLTRDSEAIDPVNTRMKHQPTTVLSSTLEEPLDWPDATLARGDAADVVARLKDESELPLRSHGSLSLNRTLMAAGLVDRLQVTIFPVISGQTGGSLSLNRTLMAAGLVDRLQVTIFPVISGQTGDAPIFAGAADFDLELIESRTLDGRTQELLYLPTRHH
ncbi:deaminase [Arthrobacter sp. Soil736]|nr:deaminase [Arthrobacter sp. Soil736]